MARLRSCMHDERGATLVETAIVFPLVLILTFGLVEFGNAMWQYATAEKATAIAARYLATRGPLVPTLADGSHDCFVDNGTNGVPVGVSCADPSVTQGPQYVCKKTGGSSDCDQNVLDTVVSQMRGVAPFIPAANVEVDVAQSEMGFIGRGRAVPLITVKTTGLTYNWVVIGALLHLSPITMPSFASTLTAEDQKEGPGI